MARTIVVADDLTGAVETCSSLVTGLARAAQPRVVDARVVLLREDDPVDVSAAVTVVDTDARAAQPHLVGERVEAVLQAGAGQSRLVLGKIDSALRGNIVELLEVLVTRGPVVMAPANPRIGRVTRAGVVHHRGRPLHATDLWRAEHRPAPQSIEALLRPRLHPVLVDFNVVSAGPLAVAEAIHAAPSGAVIVCDALTDAHLDIVAMAATLAGAQLVGSAAIAEALARSGALSPASRSAPAEEVLRSQTHAPARRDAHPLVVVGTASRAGRRQVERLRAAGTRVVEADPAVLLEGSFAPSTLADALQSGPVLVRITPGGEHAEPQSPALAQSLARAASSVWQGRTLVLIGGATARATLDAARVRWLQPMVELDVGAVLSSTDRGDSVVTRPGSFGDDTSLVRILAKLDSARAQGEPASRTAIPTRRRA